MFDPSSRSAIARDAELAGQTIPNRVKELPDSGLIYEAKRGRGGWGARSTSDSPRRSRPQWT
jgi:hypothetical protein